jgi:hypothetical protein
MERGGGSERDEVVGLKKAARPGGRHLGDEQESWYLEAPCFSLTRSRVRPNICGVVEAGRLTEQMVGLTVELA